MKLKYSKRSQVFYVTSFDKSEVTWIQELGFEPGEKGWQTSSLKVARRLKSFAEPSAIEEFARRRDAHVNAIVESSNASETDFNPEVPEGEELRPYQRAGVEYALARRHCLIADEPGVGKTSQAIAFINEVSPVRRVLIVVPASLKRNWKRELERWLTYDYTIGIAGEDFPATNIVIINYDILKKWHKELHARKWDVMIVDEAHYLKNPDAQRTVALLGRWQKTKPEEPVRADRRLFLTGTPILNRPIELQTILATIMRDMEYYDPYLERHLAPMLKQAELEFSNRWTYGKKYCNGYLDYNDPATGIKRKRPIQNVKGASNLPELQRRLRALFMVRRSKKDVLKDLPPKTYQVIDIDSEKFQDHLSREMEVIQRTRRDVLEARRRVEELLEIKDSNEYAAAVRRYREAARLGFEELSAARLDTARAKLPVVASHVELLLEEQDKVIIFAHHREIVEGLFEALKDYHPVKLYGGTPDKMRQINVDRFQLEPDCRVFIGSIDAAGVGLTLTAASHVVFAELDWVPGVLLQAGDRAHRFTQTRPVFIQYVVVQNSIDYMLAYSLMQKVEVINAAMNTEDTAESLFGEDVKTEILASVLQKASRQQQP